MLTPDYDNDEGLSEQEPFTPLKLPTPKSYPLGALVSIDSREAWISGISYTKEPLYQLTFLDDTQPQVLDWVLHTRITLLDRFPMRDKRLSKSLRIYLNSRRSTPHE